MISGCACGGPNCPHCNPSIWNNATLAEPQPSPVCKHKAYGQFPQCRIAELEAEVAALRDKVADYEYPLRENNWVKVRQEVWDAKEAKAERLEKVESMAREILAEAEDYERRSGKTISWLDPLKAALAKE